MTGRNFPATERNEGNLALLTFTRNCAEAARVAVFMRPRADRLTASWAQALTFAVVAALIPTAIDVARIGVGGQFAQSSLPEFAFGFAVVTATAVALALIGRATDDLARLAVLLFGVALVIDAAVLAVYYIAYFVHPQIRRLPAIGYLYYRLPAAWLALAALLAAVRLLEIPPARRVAALVVCTLFMGLPLSAYHERSLWIPADNDENQGDASRGSPAGEETLYGEAALLDRELAAIQPGRPGIADLYFIGVAGYAHQDVFRKEVQWVAKMFDERFDAQGRSIQLVNNARTLKISPVASSTSLARALKRVGEVMNTDEDLLFLFLSTHGSEDHRLALDFRPLELKDVDPGSLRAMLDASGIKNRVIVVSACYSGGFIDALRDDHTLVITASAADRNSFGCSNDADFTYFGKAYFNDALQQTYSFEEAFRSALPLIAAREKENGYDASDPRIAMGSAIAPLLQNYARERVAAAKARASAPAHE